MSETWEAAAKLLLSIVIAWAVRPRRAAAPADA